MNKEIIYKGNKIIPYSPNDVQAFILNKDEEILAKERRQCL